jgi:hypothetical protein
MPVRSIHEILQRRGERRSIGRTRINRGALLFISGQAGVFSCDIRDVTNQGAGVRLDGRDVLPVDFDLLFDNFRTIRECRMVWRDDDLFGVKFTN